jgi:hypothetical protein
MRLHYRAQQLPVKFLVSVRHGKLPLEKRILRDNLELVAQLAGSSVFAHGVRDTGRRVIPIRFIKWESIVPHRDSSQGSCKKELWLNRKLHKKKKRPGMCPVVLIYYLLFILYYI